MALGQGVPNALTGVPVGHKQCGNRVGTERISVIPSITPGNPRTSLTIEGAGDRAYVFGEIISQESFGIKLLLKVL